MLLCMACVLTLQPLAVQAQFRHPRLLTALSDYSYSWNSLGSSLETLYYNTRLNASLLPILTTTAYLASIVGLQTVTPLLFSFPVSEGNTSVPVQTVLSFPNFSAAGLQVFSQDKTDTQSTLFDWYLAGTALSLLSGNISANTPGVAGSILYDTLQGGAVAANGSAEVNRTEFRVRCGQLPQSPNITTSFIIDSGDVTIPLAINFLATDDIALFYNITDTLGMSVSTPDSGENAAQRWAVWQQ